jgi:hypothetical protein
VKELELALRQNRNTASILTSLVICCALIVASAWASFNKRYIIDQINYWQYQPTSEISSLASRAGLDGQGLFLFYASQPELDSTDDVSKICYNTETTTSILGCYSNYRIYISNVTNSQLDGIREVSAAHEMLHAAYARLSSEEKSWVDELVEAEYKELIGDKNLTDIMAFYSKSEPGERDNELHSIIGTEVANISPELESYYDKYFSDRQKLVALNTKYSSVFKQLQARQDELVAQINSLAEDISDRTDQYNSGVQELNSDIMSFNSRANGGDFASQAQFNSERSTLLARISSLDIERSSIDADIDKYNSLLGEYKSIELKSKELYNSINNTLAPAPSI